MHLEVILQDQPCWLYFDLEFSRLTNPELQPELAMTAFDETLSSFCEDVLGLALDAKSIIILESSTPEKFSKHVVVHRLLDKEKDTMVPLAFANNAQAGLFVNELMNYARTNREGSSARHLFVQAPKSSEADGREATLIDESVYSRNRASILTAAVSNRQSMQYLPGSSRPPRRRCCPQQTDSEHVHR